MASSALRKIFADAGLSRSDEGKLASYEVAGGDVQNGFVLKARRMARIFRRPFRTRFFTAPYQTLRVWLISGCPCRDDYLPSLGPPSRSFSEGWCANLFPDGRRRVQRRRGSSSSRNRGGDICGRLLPRRRATQAGLQIFAGIRVQTFPFFQRRVIRQSDGETKLRAALPEQLPEARDRHCTRLVPRPKKHLPQQLPILCHQ